MTAEERNKVYEEMYRKYNPYIDYSDVPFESWGCMWQNTMVIYALAQTLAFQFFAESLEDMDSAWTRYISFLQKAGTLTFPEIIKQCGLRSPFDKDCFDYIYRTINSIRETF